MFQKYKIRSQKHFVKRIIVHFYINVIGYQIL